MSGPSVIIRILVRETQECQTGEGKVTLKAKEERLEDPTLLVLKMEDEIKSQGTQVTSGS